ncbi:MAG: hypothetical protein GYA87_01265, partial [Christensenellaceae bacterium]|nr:hypothetical protein [Christensenellaceae bacterium]
MQAKNNNEIKNYNYNEINISNIFIYMFSMVISGYIANQYILGGALYLLGRVTYFYLYTLFNHDVKFFIFKKHKVLTAILTGGLIFILLFIVMNLPVAIDSNEFWVIFSTIIIILLQQSLVNRLNQLLKTNIINKKLYLLSNFIINLILIFINLIIVGFLIPDKNWMLIGLGLILSFVIELIEARNKDFSLLKIKDNKKVKSIIEYLNSIHSYKVFKYLSLLIVIGLQITSVHVSTFIVLFSDKMIVFFSLFAICVFFTRSFVEFIIKGLNKKDVDFTNLLFVGLLIWVYSLTLFYNIKPTNNVIPISAYLSIILSSIGLALTIACLNIIEKQMYDVIAFAKSDFLIYYRNIRNLYQNVAAIVGQYVALVVLAFLYFYNAGSISNLDIFYNLKPLMILPAIAVVLAATLMALKFPINKRYFEKLNKFLNIKAGEKNIPLKKQLENVFIKKHSRRVGIKIIIALLRPLYYHKLIDSENIKKYEDGTIIFICNHGELYGPVVANVYVPCSFRPWIISELYDKESFIEYTYTNTFSKQKWLPEKLQMPLAKLLAPAMIWVANSIECIPVYRNKPEELIKTFRMSVNAMESGDNLLIFPENPALDGGDGKYKLKGTGKFYSGFALMGQALYTKTNKIA